MRQPAPSNTKLTVRHASSSSWPKPTWGWRTQAIARQLMGRLACWSHVGHGTPARLTHPPFRTRRMRRKQRVPPCRTPRVCAPPAAAECIVPRPAHSTFKSLFIINKPSEPQPRCSQRVLVDAMALSASTQRALHLAGRRTHAPCRITNTRAVVGKGLPVQRMSRTNQFLVRTALVGSRNCMCVAPMYRVINGRGRSPTMGVPGPVARRHSAAAPLFQQTSLHKRL